MPLGERVRASSASGRLETQHETRPRATCSSDWMEEDLMPVTLCDPGSREQRTREGSGPGGWGEEVTDQFSAPRRVSVSEGGGQQPEWLTRELLKQNGRRRSIALGDRAQVTEQHTLGSTHSQTDGTISLDNLQKLKLAFEEHETGGSRSIDANSFGHIVKKCLPMTSARQTEGLFKRIDYSSRGRISWSPVDGTIIHLSCADSKVKGDLCAYMLQEYKEKQDTARRCKQVAFTLPATTTPCQGVPIINIHPAHDDTIVTVQEDGTVCCWSPELKPLMTKHMFNAGPASRKSKWASDFTVMKEYNKLIIATGDREIQLYELYTLDPYCQINALESVPLTVAYSCTGLDKCCILCGDAEGCVTIIVIVSVGDTLRLWNKLPKIENMPSVAIDKAALSPNVTFVRWKVHHDWVTQVKYFQSFQAVVSSSNEDSLSVVIGCMLPPTDAERQLSEIREARYEGKTKKVQLSWVPQLRAPRDHKVFTIHKGVRTFDLCQRHRLLVTGGMDRLLRLWNPYFSGKPAGILQGHSAPIAHLCISSEDSQLFSVSTDGTVKIWDIQDECCLFTAEPKASGIHGDITACSYSSAMKSLYIAADCMAALSLKIRPSLQSRVIASHNEPVTCCGFTEEFRQVVSCTEGSVVKVWDFDTGRQVFEFGGVHGLAVITCMTFDLKGRRLITGGKDGSLKIWNFNNGQCLKTLQKDGECHEVGDCIFVKVHRDQYVMSVGQGLKIDIYLHVPEDIHHVQRPQPSWPDDLKNGHKEAILCVAQCPPSLLATSSDGGEIIVWNVNSGHIQCRFDSPLPDEQQQVEGLDVSVPSIIFLKNCQLQPFSLDTALVTSGAVGFVNLWSVLSGGKFVGSFKASRLQQKITKLAQTEKTTFLYAADRIGYIYAYNVERFDPKHKTPKAENFWRAHTSRITGLQIVDDDQVVLTSSADCTVRLWSARGHFIGTFGQSESWSIHISSSWKHPAVPHEVLIDPLSMPRRETLKAETDSKLRLPPTPSHDTTAEEEWPLS